VDRQRSAVSIPPPSLAGSYAPPQSGAGVVVFTYGRGSSHPSARSGHVAAGLRRAGLGTLLLDLPRPKKGATAAMCTAPRANASASSCVERRWQVRSSPRRSGRARAAAVAIAVQAASLPPGQQMQE
jgi:hypothetical protein